LLELLAYFFDALGRGARAGGAETPAAAMMRCLTLSLLAAAAAKWPLRAPHADSVPATFDCALRKAAYDFGRKLISRLGGFESLYYALDLNDPNCHGKFAEPLVEAQAPKPSPLAPDAIFVSPTGLRGASGKLGAPLRSIQEAADLAVASGRRTVVLRDGTHYLSAPITLGAHHSGLRFVAHPGESPVVSGGVEIQTDWQPHKVQPGGSNIWVTAVGDEVDEVPGLQIGGVRATRARYPNLPGGIEVSPGYDGMIPGGDAQWTPPQFDRFGPVEFHTDVRAPRACHLASSPAGCQRLPRRARPPLPTPPSSRPPPQYHFSSILLDTPAPARSTEHHGVRPPQRRLVRALHGGHARPLLSLRPACLVLVLGAALWRRSLRLPHPLRRHAQAGGAAQRAVQGRRRRALLRVAAGALVQLDV